MNDSKWIVDVVSDKPGWYGAKWSDFLTGEPLKHLARECVQNTLDARPDDADKPTHIKFELKTVKFSEIIPDFDTFTKEFEARVKLAIEDNDTETKKDAQNSLRYFEKCIKEDKVQVLKISDFVTSGLTGIESEGGKFEKLIFAEGTSTLEGSGFGGSFGVGKFAPFAISALRTVLYSTRVENEGYGFGAKSILSYRKIENRENPHTAAQMYLANKNNDNVMIGITDEEVIKKYISLREEVGTDIYVVGIRPRISEKFVSKLVTELSERFFVAIWEEVLTCEVIDNGDSFTLNKENISDRLERNYNQYTGNEDGTYPTNLNTHLKPKQLRPSSDLFMRAYRYEDPDRIYRKKKVHGFGEVELYLRLNPVDFLGNPIKANHIIYMRKLLMKVEIESYTEQKIDKDFIGILLIKNKEGNELALACEPPTHNEWDPTIHCKDAIKQKNAEVGLEEISEWIHEILEEFKDDDAEASVFDDATYWTWQSGGSGDPTKNTELTHKYEHEINKEYDTEKKKKEDKSAIFEIIKDLDGKIKIEYPGNGKKVVNKTGKKFSPTHKNIEMSKVFHKKDSVYSAIFQTNDDIDEFEGVLFARSGDKLSELTEIMIPIDSVQDLNGSKIDVKKDLIQFKNLSKGLHEFKIKTKKSNKLAQTLYFIIKDEPDSKEGEVNNG